MSKEENDSVGYVKKDPRSDLFKTVRGHLQERLSQSTYVKIAGYYHSCMARVVERRTRKSVETPVPCDQPLVYFSQPPRSGGTLMRNLFDGHPHCHGYPHELSWEKNGYRWGSIRQMSATSVYERLYGRWLDKAIVTGLDKKYPFHFNRTLQKSLFSRLAGSGEEEEREWLDTYMTSFFNAWIDYQSLYGEKKFVVAFCPWSLRAVDPIDRFFSVYPEGFRVQVVRNPLGWWASEKKYGSHSKSVEEYLHDRWIQSVETGLRAESKHEEKYVFLHFDDLIRSPEVSMQTLAERLGLRYTPELTRPTINQIPRTSNTSFGPGKRSLDPSVLDRWRDFLEPEEVEKIRSETKTLYRRVLGKCINHSQA